MLSREEAEKLQNIIRTLVVGNVYLQLKTAIDQMTDKYAPGQGTDVIAEGPNISTRQMLDEAARALGWRTDFSTGDSPITWELVLAEIRKLNVEVITGRALKTLQNMNVKTSMCDDLVAFADGELSPERADDFRIHLRTCKGCQEGLVEAMQTSARLSTMAPRLSRWQKMKKWFSRAFRR